MPIPAGNVTTANLDATTDSPATARADLLALTQQFNSLIASANGVSGMAALDASGFLAGYGRLVAAQTWTAVNTFTAATPIILSSASPIFRGRNTSIALPNGLWQLYLPWTDDKIYFQKNTAAAGDFSSVNNVFILAAAQATFSVPVAVGSGVAAGDAVNKGQLDAKVYGGHVNAAGTAVYLPTGWSSVRNSAGSFTITHNLGTTNYAPVVGSSDLGIKVNHTAIGVNSFNVQTYNLVPNPIDSPFTFVVVRN